ncbi:MAG: sugar transferase [Sphingomonas sp.]
MMFKRIFDLSAVLLLLPVMLPMAGLVAIAVALTSPGAVIYWSHRVGQHNKLFSMPKFRTMKIDTPAVATHLLVDPHQVLTPIGGFLRAASLDEIPQLWSVMRGDMSFVGPRPALFNQEDLIALRTERDIDQLKPGITGWAQINGRDSLEIPRKVEFEVEYMKRRTFWFDLKIIALTVIRVLKKADVQH